MAAGGEDKVRVIRGKAALRSNGWDTEKGLGFKVRHKE